MIVEQLGVMVKPTHLSMFYSDQYNTTLHHFCFSVNITIRSA
jgi:hypothetical protein